jgi:hypothetical protein
MKHLGLTLENIIATCTTSQSALQYRYKTLATYLWNNWNTWNRCLQHVVSARTTPCCLGEWILVGVCSSIPAVAGCTWVSCVPVMTNLVGGHKMCVTRLHPGCRGLHASELHTWLQWDGQAEAEVFLATNQASPPPCGGGDSGLPHHGRAHAAHPAKLVHMQTAAALVRTPALAELVCTRPKAGRCDGADANGKDKMSLSFIFYFFGETVYVDEGSMPMGQSAFQLAASGLTNAERTPVIEH